MLQSILMKKASRQRVSAPKVAEVVARASKKGLAFQLGLFSQDVNISKRDKPTGPSSISRHSKSIKKPTEKTAKTHSSPISKMGLAIGSTNHS